MNENEINMKKGIIYSVRPLIEIVVLKLSVWSSRIHKIVMVYGVYTRQPHK